MLTIHSPYQKNINSLNIDDTTHLSLGYVAKRMQLLAYLAKIQVKEIKYPDIYRTKIASEFLKTDDGSIENINNIRKTEYKKNNVNTHISIAPWNDMRINITSDRNIAHFSWEQTNIVINKHAPYFGSSIVETLNSFDRIWACSKILASSLIENGIRSVIFFPTPIISPVKKITNTTLINEINMVKENIFFPYFIQGPGSSMIENIKDIENNAAHKFYELINKKIKKEEKNIKIFITQGNPGDTRKGLISTIIGFNLFAESYSGNAYLIVKMPPRMQYKILNEIGPSLGEIIRWGSWGSNKIIFLPCNLSDEAQYELYSLSDFYICCPIAEGQNIPLQEAIQCGCYPISPIHSAMNEYLVEELISPIKHKKQNLDPIKYCGVSISEYIGYKSDYLDIADACQRAVDTSIEVRSKRIQELQENYLFEYRYDSLITKFKAEVL